MTSNLSRRGLLGLMAAAPVAAVAKPAIAPKRTKFPAYVMNLRDLHDGIYYGAGGVGEARFSAWRDFTPIEDHPPGGLFRLADEGPGAPANTTPTPGGCPSAGIVKDAPGAPVPDEENPILKHARAC